MIRFVFIFLLVASAVRAEAPPKTIDPEAWKLTFADEFDSLDLARYDTAINGKPFIAEQGEQQAYISPNPFSVHDGILTIRADRPSPSIQSQLHGQRYTSGILNTRYSFHQLYGFFEMRAKLPLGRGLWPTFWLLPIDGSWPPEIDVVEVLGHEPHVLHTTIHFTRGHRPDSTGFATHVADTTKAFHTYGVLWTETYVAWYFDRQRVAVTATPSTMRKSMYMLMNLAVGGKWPGSPDASTAFPADMQIDYLRAYALP